MVKLATEDNSCFSTTDIELTRPNKSYSIDTIRYFRERQSEDLFFILGSDAFVEIETWWEFQNLFALCNFIVMTRPGFEKNFSSSLLPKSLSSLFRYEEEKVWVHASGHTLQFKEITVLDISSTKIRELMAKGESIRYLVPEKVDAYVRDHGLYRASR
jgi:nicotinate-nucleotide adenylyltransferase